MLPSILPKELNIHVQQKCKGIYVAALFQRRKWQPIPASFPGKSHGQKSLVGCSPWSHKESGITEQLTLTNINPSSPLTWDIFPFIFVFLSFFF